MSLDPTTEQPPSSRCRVRRSPDRAHYDKDTVHAIVDAAWLCHVALAVSAQADADVLCLPTACWRVGDRLYIHGSTGSRMMKRLADGAPACVAITHLDGLVMARSAFSHSMNYRSVVIHGRFEVVPPADKPAILDALMEHLAPGRCQEVRAPDDSELQATFVLGMALHEAAAKIRAWGPRDKARDTDWPAWAGVLPLAEQRLPPLPEGDTSLPEPDYVQRWAEASPTSKVKAG